MGKSVLLSVALLLTAAIPAPAETRLVPGNYATIQQAINGSNDGDVVVVEPGTYFEIINFLGKNIVVTSNDPDNREIVATTIIDGDGQGSVVTFENGETPEAVLTGFTITGGYGTVNPLFDVGGERIWIWGAGIYCDHASPTIKGNVITNNNGPVRIERNQIVAAGYGGAIGCIESDAIITHNIIRGNSAYAGAGIMTFMGAEPTFIGPTISNNLICNNSAYVGGGAAVLLGCGRLINNTIVGNDASLLQAAGETGIGGNIYIESDPQFPPCQIINNIVCNAKSGGGIFSTGLREDLRAFFNNVWNNAGGNYGAQNPYTGETRFDGPVDRTGIDGNISEDPLFADLEDNDYHLQLDSPCMSAGDPDFAPKPNQTDIDGEPRIYGVGIDMGADEYVGPLRPVADAGPDQHVDSPRLITLAGSVSFIYDPCSVVTFEWNQLAGPAVELSNSNSKNPTFVPEFEGEYLFELVISDSTNNSQPDEVLIIVRNREPVADAGPDQSMSSIPVIITLDGSRSYDPSGDNLTYHWRQTAGPAVKLSDEKTVETDFVPSEIGVYVFELVVNDGLIDSDPNVVGIVIGNRAPIADAGLPRYAARDPVVPDGTRSFDPDGYGELTYHWQQISGPSVDITDGNTATPTISGFIQGGAIQRCEFELTVSDGDLVSEPDILEVIVVPYFGNKYLVQANPPFDPAKPTIVGFGGGDCSTGGPMTMSLFPDWYAKANFLTVRSSYGPPYYQYGDALIVYLSSVAPDYTQPIQTIGFSTGSMPAIDLAIHVNETYADARFAVNRVSLLDAGCRDYGNDIANFLASSVDGESCWIDNYYTTADRYYRGTLSIRFPAPPATHHTPHNWYKRSATPLWHDGDLYNDGVTAGYYLSVAGPGKNLRLTDVNDYYFKWNPETDYLELYDESLYPARIPQPPTLIGPVDGAFVDANGALFSCEVSESAVSYQLLLGADPQNLNYIVSDTPNPPEKLLTVFPFETTYWTIMTRDEYGATIYAEPLCIECENVEAQASIAPYD